MTQYEIDLICSAFGLVRWWDTWAGHYVRLDGRNINNFHVAWQICDANEICRRVA